MRFINAIEHGAHADGIRDDFPALQDALGILAISGGTLYFPPGFYRLTQPLVATELIRPLALQGAGAGVSQLFFDGECDGIRLRFEQDEYCQQPYGLTMSQLGLCAATPNCQTALEVSYGMPSRTSDHNRPSVEINDVRIGSAPFAAWRDGIRLQSAWNPTLSNVFISGDSCGGDWNRMRGSGVSLEGMCVNAHLSNVRTNFFAEGIKVHANSGLNTEGIFCSNCSMVGVKRGVWVQGNAAQAPGRISTFNWHGGLIECRVKGVTGGSAAFHFQNVWTALVSGCQMITETITENAEITYGVCAQDCHGVVVNGCDINAFLVGVMTTGPSRGIAVLGNTFTNTPLQGCFTEGSVNVRHRYNVLVNNTRNVVDASTSEE